jgi:hypothetical protein
MKQRMLIILIFFEVKFGSSRVVLIEIISHLNQNHFILISSIHIPSSVRNDCSKR